MTAPPNGVRTGRPSHMALQAQLDETLAGLPTQRWRWLFTPDPAWLNTVNTTALRTVNAIRMFIGVTVLFALMEIGVVIYGLTRCGITIKVANFTIFQLTPPPGKLTVEAWRACEDSLATGKILEFASELFNTYSLLLAAMAGIALGAMAVKRATDTEHKVRVEEAKKAPIILPPTTNEHTAQPAVKQEVNIVASGDVTAVPPVTKPAEEPNLYIDDERG